MTKLSGGKFACAVFLLFVANVGVDAQTFITLVDFNGRDGRAPAYTSLVQGLDGDFFGTTALGGPQNDCGAHQGCGTAFKVKADGTFEVLRLSPVGGTSPLGGMLGAQTFVGTTYGGGANSAGTVFELTSTGRLTTLYSFCSQSECVDGEWPIAGLTRGVDGNFYGTTGNGGSSSGCNNGCGTLFRITPRGELTTLHSFCAEANCTDGALPTGALVQGTDGAFYGTAFEGGGSDQCGGGVIFKFSAPSRFTVLHNFDCSDGTYPWGGLVLANDGYFYGTAEAGGANQYGTVFRIKKDGEFSTLHSFDIFVDGGAPTGTLIQATDGNLYGTTSLGGANDLGTIFVVTTQGALTTLHSFSGDDGAYPEGRMLQATSGKLYGTSGGGGTFLCGSDYGCGTVFSLDMGLGPFVTFVRAAGRVGQTGPILGQGFTGTTTVLLNGVPASFTVVSDTYIRATVPAGATTGYVTVTTPSGTLTSNVPFHVIR